MNRFRSLIPYILRQRRWLGAIFVLTLVSSATAALQPWPMKMLVDYALGDQPVPDLLTESLKGIGLAPTPSVLLVSAAAFSFLLFVLGSVLTVTLSVCWTYAGQRMVYDLAGDLFARLQRLSLIFHTQTTVGDSLSRLTGDAKVISSLADNLLLTPIQETIVLIAMICIGFALDPVLACLALAVAPLLAASSRFFGKRLRRRAKLGREAKSRLMTLTHQTFKAIPIVQAFGTVRRHTQHFERLADDAVRLQQKGNLLGSSYGIINGLITTTGMALVLFVGGVRVLDGAIPLGTLLVFLSYVRRMQSASGSLFKVFAKLKSAEASVDRIMEVLDSCDEVFETRSPIALPSTGRIGQVRFDNVTFGYDPDTPILKGISLEARPGEMIAIVGATGAGKSTLVSMIPRFFDPWEGFISVGDVNTRRLRLSDLRSQISIVLQDPFLMPTTVSDNIAYGRPQASRIEVERAATAAQAHDFIRKLPDGYDTILGESGCSLSGGERQRLAIARAILRDTPILILDEPTSALDAETEASLMEALRRLIQGRTTFIIAHRLSTIREADQVAILDNGHLAELGTHAQLLEKDGLFRRFYEHQFAGGGVVT